MKSSRINPYLWLIIGYLVGSGLLYWKNPTFANSSFFVASITFLGAGIAFYIYAKQRADEKVNAATTLLLEIRNAERTIDTIIDKMDKGATSDLPRVLPVNSWRTNSHRLVKYLDLDDIQLLNDFYASCEVIEDLAGRQNNFVWITTEERAKAVQSMLASIHDDFQKDSVMGDANAKRRFDSRKSGLGDFYVNEGLSYAPKKILQGLEFQTNNLKRITTTPCGEKLKALAQLSS